MSHFFSLVFNLMCHSQNHFVWNYDIITHISYVLLFKQVSQTMKLPNSKAYESSLYCRWMNLLFLNILKSTPLIFRFSQLGKRLSDFALFLEAAQQRMPENSGGKAQK